MLRAMPRDLPPPPARHQRANGAFEVHFATAARGPGAPATVLRHLFQQARCACCFRRRSRMRR
ncbi:hypothetical protein ACFQU2_26305 [Siccirubricoccus deserti]